MEPRGGPLHTQDCPAPWPPWGCIRDDKKELAGTTKPLKGSCCASRGTKLAIAPCATKRASGEGGVGRRTEVHPELLRCQRHRQPWAGIDAQARSSSSAHPSIRSKRLYSRMAIRLLSDPALSVRHGFSQIPHKQAPSSASPNSPCFWILDAAQGQSITYRHTDIAKALSAACR